MYDMEEQIEFANIVFNGLHKEDVIKIGEKFKQIVTVNAEFIVEANRNEHFRKILANSCTTFDGQVPYILSKIFHAKKSYEKISGADLIYDIAEACRKADKRIFLLGASADANKEASIKLSSIFGIEVGGYAPPFSKYPFSIELNNSILKQIELFKPDYLFVAFGAVKQELWISDHQSHLQEIGVKVAIGCGGAIDFVSGKLKRAPGYIQKLGFEGLYRLVVEPKAFRFKRLIKSLYLFKYI